MKSIEFQKRNKNSNKCDNKKNVIKNTNWAQPSVNSVCQRESLSSGSTQAATQQDQLSSPAVALFFRGILPAKVRKSLSHMVNRFRGSFLRRTFPSLTASHAG